MVIFAGVVAKTFHVGVIFVKLLIFPYGNYFRMGEIFLKKTISQKKHENFPHAKIFTLTVF